jgi:hypothetical protein
MTRLGSALDTITRKTRLASSGITAPMFQGRINLVRLDSRWVANNALNPFFTQISLCHSLQGMSCVNQLHFPESCAIPLAKTMN